MWKGECPRLLLFEFSGGGGLDELIYRFLSADRQTEFVNFNEDISEPMQYGQPRTRKR